jgi:branched-subunit amino acid transport protein AzlD
MISLRETPGFVFAMGAVIFFCRAFPFLFFSGGVSGKKDGKTSVRESFINFVEKIVPPAAMTVLAFNSLGSAYKDNPRDGLLVLAASVFTALIHLWKRNSLASIIGGTALYMILMRVIQA